ncbi:universal stress protein [Streptomyces sp. NPDC047737]|uniref:universal stress protein n=1 Tax=unclassified Streptomyces TaxID=2593676 RepID=UPI0033DFFCFE
MVGVLLDQALRAAHLSRYRPDRPQCTQRTPLVAEVRRRAVVGMVDSFEEAVRQGCLMIYGSTSSSRIVVGVDGSEPSQAAVRAAERARGTGEAVFAWESPASWYGPTPPSDEEMRTYASRARKIFDQVVEDAPGPGPGRPVPLRPTAVQAHAAAVLIDAAAGAEVRIVGDRGRGEFREALLGSVSMHCAQHAPSPVVVMR